MAWPRHMAFGPRSLGQQRQATTSHDNCYNDNASRQALLQRCRQVITTASTSVKALCRDKCQITNSQGPKREDEIRTFKETSEYREARLADDVKYLTEKYVKYRVRFYAMRYLLLLMSRQVEESYPAAMVNRLAHCPSCLDALVNPCQ